MKLTPASRAFATIRVEVASSVGPPNIMVPRQIGEIFRPLRPRGRYCIGGVLSGCAPSPRPSRGEGWGEGLLSAGAGDALGSVPRPSPEIRVTLEFRPLPVKNGERQADRRSKRRGNGRLSFLPPAGA